MNDHPMLTPPEAPDEQLKEWESAVHNTARQFIYPPTPDIAGSVRARLKHPSRRGMAYGLRVALAALLALAVVTLAVPQTRAFVLEALRVGVVRIFFGEPTATATLSPQPSSSAGQSVGSSIPRPTQSFAPGRTTPVASALDLSGETTLTDAQQQLGVPILLPTYPADLGAPDHVYAQQMGGTVVTLVWLQADDPTRIDLLLQILNAEMVASKYFPWEASNQQEVVVNGQEAFWLTDVHRLYFYQTADEISRIVDKDVLLWEVDGLTYRLETDLPLTEAIRVDESLE